jgi:hypothetical protein
MGIVTFTSVEHPDVSALDLLISNWDALSLSPDQRKPVKFQGKDYPVLPLLKKYRKLVRNGSVPISYEYSKSSVISGRQFSKGSPSLQGMKRWIRHTLAPNYHDYDKVNCHPTIFVQYCLKKGWDASPFESYLTNRDKYLSELMEKNDLTRDDAKEVVLSILNGGSKDYKSLVFKPLWLTIYRVAVEDIQHKMLCDPENSKLLKSIKEHKLYNIGGSLMNHLLCHIENQSLMLAIEFLHVKEPVLCFDGFMSTTLYSEADLTAMSDYVFEKLGYRFKWIKKPMSEGIDLSCFSIDTDGEIGDHQAAQIFVDWCRTKNLEIVSVSDEVIWYSPESGLWSRDIKSIKPWIFKCKSLPDTYRDMDRNQHSLLNQLRYLIPVDNDWYVNRKSVGYIPLANGVWDFKNKQIVDYRSEFGYFCKLKIDWHPDIDTSLVEERLFSGLFKPDDATYVKTIISRAMAGHLDKILLFFLGDGNSGKGLFEAAFKKMLGQLYGVILGASLTGKDSGGDSGKLLSWMIKIKDCLLAFCQEINMKTPLDGVTLKKISSGGDICQARTNNTDEIDFILQPLVIIAANDLPSITPMDDALRNRAAYVEMTHVYLSPDQIASYTGDKIVAVNDASIKEVWAVETFTSEALFALLANSYSEIKPNKPSSIVQASNEWTEADNIEKKVRDLFEVNVGSHITTKALLKIVEQNNIQVSPNRLGRIMKSFGHESKQKTINGSSIRAYWDLVLKIFE